jgi:argininosuccinate lyase
LDLLRGKRLDEIDKNAARYISSVKPDEEMLREVININQAHIVMLVKKKIISERDGANCLRALDILLSEGMKLDESLEDVHANVEAKVIQIAGRSGGLLNLAKSRNDQVATSIRMACRRHLIKTLRALGTFQSNLRSAAESHYDDVMPGYTHLQHAQPVTLGHHLGAHVDALLRDSSRLVDSYKVTNCCPMGAAALSGTSYSIDRKMMVKLLGFDGIVENTIDAVSARDFAIQILSTLAILMTHISKLAEELILWSSAEFSFVSISDSFSSTSSIMPNKKNPVVAEIARAKASRIFGNVSAALSLVKSLPLSYNLDLQELTPLLWDSFGIVEETLTTFAKMILSLEFDVGRMEGEAKDGFSIATELADFLVSRYKISFRESHHIVGFLVKKMVEKKKTLQSVKWEDVLDAVSSVSSAKLELAEAGEGELRSVLSPYDSLTRKKVVGSPNPKVVKGMLEERKAKVEKIAKETEELQEKLDGSFKLLEEEIRSITSSSSAIEVKPLEEVTNIS